MLIFYIEKKKKKKKEQSMQYRNTNNFLIEKEKALQHVQCNI